MTGASSGIGAEVAQRLAAEGFRVIAIARRGKLAYYEAFGHLDGARTRPMPRDDPVMTATLPVRSKRLMARLS